MVGTKSLSQYNGPTEIKAVNFDQQTLRSNQPHFAGFIWSPLVLWQMQYSAGVLQPGRMISCIHTLPGLHTPHTKGSFVITLVPTNILGRVGLIALLTNTPPIQTNLEYLQKAACLCSGWLVGSENFLLLFDWNPYCTKKSPWFQSTRFTPRRRTPIIGWAKYIPWRLHCDWYIYLQLVDVFNGKLVGTHTSPMDPMGIWIKQSY